MVRLCVFFRLREHLYEKRLASIAGGGQTSAIDLKGGSEA